MEATEELAKSLVDRASKVHRGQTILDLIVGKDKEEKARDEHDGDRS